ncbi:hypothetical protein ACPV5L_05020 [Vibrio astriarenae]|jgi:hypothetical protein|uniref:hypothetical protein n=1 Tax=Vibrio agarivorans TaxID=153622 RepID=UPI00222E9372|nr:hypothetical protein [Vibrio agarivorans]MDN3662932.1 hypothetical protein [Vibrio agarivorans]
MSQVNNEYQMAIDLLCCHLGVSENEAKKQLGIKALDEDKEQQIAETQYALMGLSSEQ